MSDDLLQLCERLDQAADVGLAHGPLVAEALAAIEQQAQQIAYDGKLSLERIQRIADLTAENERLREALRQAHIDVGMVACDGAMSGIAGERIRAALKDAP